MVDLVDLKRLFNDRNFHAIKNYVKRSISNNDHEYIHHPLGFLLAELLKQDGTVLRLHYWRHDLIDAGSAITPYHDHVWRLSSCVLFGEIENCVLDVVTDPEGDFFLTEVEQFSGVDHVPSEGNRVSFNITERQRVKSGEFYHLPPRVFHFSNMVEGRNALTLVLSETEISGSPRTLVPFEVSGHTPKRTKVSNSAEVSAEILSILEL